MNQQKIEKNAIEEHNEGLQTILNYFFNKWNFSQEKDIEIPFLELFITPYCNQKCTYCYLQKNKDKLYPPEYTKEKNILNNLDIFFEYLIENNVTFLPRLDLFSGEIWGWPYGNKVFDIILKHLRSNKIQIKQIVIPSNCSFCIDRKLFDVIKYYKKSFSQQKCDLCFSISMDGPYLDKINRPFHSKEKTDQYYKNIAELSKEYGFGFHPMIDASTIELQTQNYTSWIEYLKSIYPDPEDFAKTYSSIMQLEVRSSDWTKEKIQEYLKWLNFVLETDKKEYFENDLQKLFNYIINGHYSKNIAFKGSYIPYLLNSSYHELPGCSYGKSLQIRVGDLAIVPCHRLAYEKLVFGKFKLENNKIVGINTNNLPFAVSTYFPGFVNKPKCGTCNYSQFCIYPCYGVNYEVSGELYYPFPEQCDFQIGKIAFLCYKFIKMGILELMPNENLPEEKIQYYKTKILKLIQLKEIKEWKPFIMQII